MEKNFKCWPAGISRNLDYPEVPVFQILRSAALQWPDRNAIVFGGAEVTCREMDLLSDRFANATWRSPSRCRGRRETPG